MFKDNYFENRIAVLRSRYKEKKKRRAPSQTFLAYLIDPRTSRGLILPSPPPRVLPARVCTTYIRVTLQYITYSRVWYFTM